MSDLAEADSRAPPLLRDRTGVQRVTNIELFFDLVYVFAITQLSHYLLGHATVAGAVVAFAGAVALWWLYFDQSASAAAEKIARSDDPGRLGRSACHLIHPVMVAGINRIEPGRCHMGAAEPRSGS